jgi:recombination protein RecA
MPVSADLLKTLNKKYGDTILRTFSDNSHQPVDVISTGALSVDYCSGVGGIPRGRITELYGPESTGKTTLCQYIIAHAQEQNLNVAYIDTEQSFDPSYAKLCGVNLDSLVFCQPDSLDAGLLFTEDLLASGEFGLIVFDSVVGISPKKELDDELTDANVSLISRLITRFCRRNIYTIRDLNTALVFTNQVRDKIGAYIPTLETTGGHALKHFAAVRLLTGRVKDIKEGDEVIGTEFRATFKKNKVAAPYKTAGFSIYFGKGIWKAEDVLTNALTYGIINMRGSYVVYDGNTIAQGKAAAIEELENKPELMAEISKKLLDTLGDTSGT